jgi:hypothetical protein
MEVPQIFLTSHVIYKSDQLLGESQFLSLQMTFYPLEIRKKTLSSHSTPGRQHSMLVQSMTTVKEEGQVLVSWATWSVVLL